MPTINERCIELFFFSLVRSFFASSAAIMSSYFSRRLFDTNVLGFFSGGGLSGVARRYWNGYYKTYIETNSIQPLIHIILLYSATGYTITESQKHKYHVQQQHH